MDPVNAKEHVSKGTGLYTVLAYGAAALGLLVATLSSMGIALLLLPIGWIVQWFQSRRIRALIRGSGLQVHAGQFPELHAMVEQFSARLGLKATPDVFIVEDSMQNGFAMKLGRKNVVTLTDDVIWSALQSRDPHALGYVVGHELGHIALGHTGALRSFLSTACPPLRRADEFSSDNIASALVGDPRIAVSGLMLLLVGPQLLPHVNEQALLTQAREVCSDKQSKKAERNLSHPLLMRRIGNVLKYF